MAIPYYVRPGKEIYDTVITKMEEDRDSLDTAFTNVAVAIALKKPLYYMGVWDASTTVFPVATETGQFWIVSVGGVAGGITWNIGDWAVFRSPASWDKIDNTDLVISVNGQIGAVVLAQDDVADGPVTYGRVKLSELTSGVVNRLSDGGAPAITADVAAVAAAVTASHAIQHSITSTTNHTSSATSGKLLKADANGLPIDATNTDGEVSGAVSASHAKSHSVTSTTDHTSSATAGKLLKADANGLPIDATNTDGEVSGAVSSAHARSHSITGSSDHTSSATSGKMLKADANGLPIDATNTDAEVAAAVTACTPAAPLVEATTNRNLTVGVDAEKFIDFTNAGPNTITVPKDATSLFLVGSTVSFRQNSAGAITITPEDGAIVINSLAGLKTQGQYSVATIMKVAANLWTAWGNLGA